MTILPSTAALAAPKPKTPTVGYDVSYPQCPGPLPTDPAFGIVGVSDGLAYGQNPCLATEYAWAAKAPLRPVGFYMNTGNPGTAATRADWYSTAGPNFDCSPADEAACAYNYGYNGAAQALAYAGSQAGATAAMRGTWWLDVETANSWSGDTSLNVADIQGSIDYLTANVAAVGVYSTGYQWGVITGGASFPSLPNWVAGAINAKRAESMCDASFTGGAVRYVQYSSGGFDADYAC